MKSIMLKQLAHRCAPRLHPQGHGNVGVLGCERLKVERARKLVQRQDAVRPPADEDKVAEVRLERRDYTRERLRVLVEFSHSIPQQIRLDDPLPDLLRLLFT